MYHHKKISTDSSSSNNLKLETNNTTLDFPFNDEKTFREALASINPLFRDNRHQYHIIIDIRNLSTHPALDIDKMGELLYAYDLTDYAFFITASPRIFEILHDYFRTDHLFLGDKIQSFPTY